MDKANGFGAARDDPPTAAAPGAADPTPVDLAALIERLRELGHPRATIANLADKLNIKRPTLIRWINKDQPFAPKYLEAARQWESNLQAEIAVREAEGESESEEESAPEAGSGLEAPPGEPTEPKDGLSGGEGGAEGEKAAGEAQAAGADADEDEWERRQRQYAPAQRLRGNEKDAALIARVDEALRRLRAATPRSTASLRGFTPMPGGGGLEFDPACTEPMMLPPQVTETLVRGDVTVTVGDPNVGKSQLLSVTAMAIAHNAVTELLGEAGDGWLGAALFASNEERPSYVRARWKELVKTLPPEKRKKYDKLVLWNKRLVLGRFDDGVIIPTEECCEFVERLADWAEQGTHFAYIGLDPLSTLFAGIKENDPVQTGDAVRFMKRIAEAAYAAVEVSHHTSKATRGQETATAARGSTGTGAASDIMGTLITLPDAEHDRLGFPPGKIETILRRKGVRSRGKRAGDRYFEREIVNLPAEDERYPGVLARGTVAVLRPIALPVKAGLDLDDVQRWLWEAHQGDGKKRLTRGQHVKGNAGEAVVLVMRKGGCDRPTAEAAVDDLVRMGRARLDEVWINGKNLRQAVIPTEPAAAGAAVGIESPV